MIAAIVLAAGLSQRMGKPKMLLPWGEKTVIENVIDTLVLGGVERIIVVTGSQRAQVEEVLRSYPVVVAYNPDYANGEMLVSLQTGIRELDETIQAILIVLGDQPQIRPEVVQVILKSFRQSGGRLIIPSFQMHRGHPWLVERSFWLDLTGLQAPATLRDFLNLHKDEITYIHVENLSILTDMDTPEAYEREKPKGSSKDP